MSAPISSLHPHLTNTARSSTQVALKAREVLIVGQMPSYEDRLNQMEAILKNSVVSHHYGEEGPDSQYVSPCVYISTLILPYSRTPSSEILRELTDSKYTVYDVLPAFFHHESPMVSLGNFLVVIFKLLLTCHSRPRGVCSPCISCIQRAFD